MIRGFRGIATSSAHQTVQHHLTAHNLVGRFNVIVGHGDYACGKPAPDRFLKAAERLGIDPWLCLALEDSHNGVRSLRWHDDRNGAGSIVGPLLQLLAMAGLVIEFVLTFCSRARTLRERL